MIYELKATQMMEITAVILSLIGSFFILRNNLKRYGLLYFISSLTGAFLCFVFVSIGFYSFPARLIPMSPIPIIEIFTVIPFYVLFGVRYSPSKWGMEDLLLLGDGSYRDAFRNFRVIPPS
ncbi:CBO0543 family protein [Parageobacillus toebii]|uniref:CBO0543 family protein n=1 Tax=Parageobacillus toebii TaxID=153151 RepID=UPI0028151E65|nr:CBO0543 family protein [Parageobacillus toebii]WMT20363.1 CBO0543 family protein [Parageobacillus toebii]